MNKSHITMRSCISLAAVFAATTFATGASADDNRHKAIMSMNPSAYWPLDQRAIQQPVRDAAGRDDDGFVDGVRVAQPGSAPGRLSMTFGPPGINLVDTGAAVQGNGARTVVRSGVRSRMWPFSGARWVAPRSRSWRDRKPGCGVR